MAHECWAKTLGDCGGGISREHSISECVYPDQKVIVSGFDFCKDAPKEMHINSLTAKILCRDHNSRLGQEVDHVGGDLFKSVRAFTEHRNRQAEYPSVNWTQRHYKIDASRLERWFLKIMIGIGFSGSLTIGSGDLEAGVIPPKLVRIAFGLEQFSLGQGMYVAFRDKETFQLEDRFRYTAKAIEQNLRMGYFLIHGLRFYLNLQETNGRVYQSIEGSNVFYRQAHFVESSVDLQTPEASTIRAMIRRPISFSQKLSIS
jgi:hypothetical protein